MLRTLAALALLSPAAPAAAASSPWFESDGGAVRIVTTGLGDEDGRLRGALEIRLEPGWKTYWRDPGPSGVPPQIDLAETADASGVQILFPPPERFSDAYATWAGYRHGVSLPLVFTLPDGASAGIIEGSLFLGICETICIPFEASFSFDAGADPEDPADAAVVEAAFATLPEEAANGFRISRAQRQGGSLRLEAELPEGRAGKPQLFIASPEGVQLGAPELAAEGNGAAFSAAVLQLAGEDTPLDYTLVVGDRAVSGRIVVP